MPVAVDSVKREGASIQLRSVYDDVILFAGIFLSVPADAPMFPEGSSEQWQWVKVMTSK